MTRRDVHIPSPEGEIPAYAFTPDQGAGPWPAAILYTDAFAIRPTMFEMAQRLASNGYFVLLPDLFWRVGPYEPMNPGEMLSDPAKREALFTKLIPSASPDNAMKDTRALLDWLAKEPQAKADKVGTTGYCMGGRLSLTAAGTYPDRIAAAGAFHAGGVATDAPDSPHLLAPKVKARLLVGGADQDAGFDEAQCARLDTAYKDAGVDATVTIWPGAKHGYAVNDSPVYDRDASERHWSETVALFDATLKEKTLA
jgi:carboxymethylenebutenolidase